MVFDRRRSIREPNLHCPYREKLYAAIEPAWTRNDAASIYPVVASATVSAGLAAGTPIDGDSFFPRQHSVLAHLSTKIREQKAVSLSRRTMGLCARWIFAHDHVTRLKSRVRFSNRFEPSFFKVGLEAHFRLDLVFTQYRSILYIFNCVVKTLEQ